MFEVLSLLQICNNKNRKMLNKTTEFAFWKFKVFVQKGFKVVLENSLEGATPLLP